jgi:hypothetical protein
LLNSAGGPGSTFLLSAITYDFGDGQAAALLKEMAHEVPANQLLRLSQNAAYHELEPLLHLISVDCSQLHCPLDLPQELLSRWAQIHEMELARSAIIQFGAAKAMATLANAGIRAIPLKGYFLASSFYERKGARAFRDLDLLVEKDSLQALDEALRKAGFVPQPGRPSFVPAPAHTVYSLPLEESDMAMEVDIHIGMHWPEEYFQRTNLIPEDLWAEASPLDVEGQPAWGMSREHLVATTLLDVAINHRYARLIKFRDLYEILHDTVIKWDAMISLCERWKVRSYVGPGLRFMSGMDPDIDIPKGVLDSILPSYPLMNLYLRTLPLASLPNHRSRSFSSSNLCFFLLADTPIERARGLMHIPSHMLRGRHKV